MAAIIFSPYLSALNKMRIENLWNGVKAVNFV